MLITTILTFFVIRYGWGYPLALCIAATGCFFAVDLAFFASNLLKLFQGGWFPLMIGGGVFMLMMTWKQGRSLLNDKLRADAIDLKDFLESVFLSPPTRVDGTAVFLTAEPGAVPNALLHNLKHNKVLPRQNLFVTVRNHEVPWIGRDKRLQVRWLSRKKSHSQKAAACVRVVRLNVCHGITCHYLPGIAPNQYLPLHHEIP